MTPDLDLAIDEFEQFAQNLKAEIKEKEKNRRSCSTSSSPTENAVRNLDDLIADIETFSEQKKNPSKLAVKNQAVRPQSMWDEKIERDLDDLTEKMINSFKGVNEEPTSSSDLGSCDQCEKNIEDKSIIADGKKFHLDCFLCHHCQSRLMEKYFIVDGKYFCEEHKLMSLSSCSECGEKISGTIISSNQKKYHPNCFKCSVCQEPLDGKYFTTVEGDNICEKDYKNSRERCAHCTLPILNQILSALDKKYHPDCFRCALCDVELDGIPFVKDGKSINCRDCYVKYKATQCFACSKGIVSSPDNKTAMITCEGRTYHEDCFNCMGCGEGLADKGFRSVRDSVFCANCSTPAKLKLVYNSPKNRVTS